MNEKGEIKIYQSERGTEIDVKFFEDTVWLSQDQMAKIFNKDSDTVSDHIKNIYNEGELDQDATTGKFPVAQIEGTRAVKREISFYNLDVIISVGYRVNSKQGTQFRIWATKVLKDHIVNGFTLNQKRLLEKQKLLIDLQELLFQCY